MVPAPRGFDANYNFTADNIGGSDVTAAYELARQCLAAQWALGVAVFQGYAANITRLVYTPQRSSCPASAGLSNISWMAANTTGFVPVYSLIGFANVMLAMNMDGEPGTNETLFLEICVNETRTSGYDFCGTVFQPAYYPFATLTNYAAASTVWRDLVSLLSVYTSTFSECGLDEDTQGCFGYVDL